MTRAPHGARKKKHWTRNFFEYKMRRPALYARVYLYRKEHLPMPKIFIGNIPHASSDADLQQWVESRGFQVHAVQVIYDRVTGKSRGFGFVTLGEEVDMQTAINMLNGRRMDGRVLTVNEATPLTAPSYSHGRTGSLQNPT